MVIASDVHARESKIGNSDVALGVDQNVLRLQISVDDVLLVQVLKSQHHLGCVEPSLVLVEASLSAQEVEKFSA